MALALYGTVGDDDIATPTNYNTIYCGPSWYDYPVDYGNDVTHGSPGTDYHYGFGGNDTLNGYGGGDYLYGCAGDDVLNGFGGAPSDLPDGNDVLNGGPGNDTLDGGDGFDTASYAQVGATDPGGDYVILSTSTGGVTVNLGIAGPQNTGGAGTDVLISIENLTGSQFSDSLIGDNNDNVIKGGAGNFGQGSYGNDTLIGNGGNDELDGFYGSDLLDGGAGGDTLDGGDDGNDTLIGGPSDDILKGGYGLVIASYISAPSAVAVSLAISGPQNTLGAGYDNIYGAGFSSSGLFGVKGLTGSAYADTLTGDQTDNIIDGGPGPSDDTLDGGAGNDTVSYASATVGVQVSLATSGPQNTGFSGNDILSNFENITGSPYDDMLTGDTGANRLDGGLGSDTLIGGEGDDTYVLRNLHRTGTFPVYRYFYDAVTENPGEGIDTVEVQKPAVNSIVSSYALPANVENGVVTGTDIFTLYGNELNNSLNGNSGNNTLSGGNGRDTLIGWAGADNLDGGAGVDLADYSRSTTGVNVDLAGGTGAGGYADGDVLTNIENVIGTSFADSLAGNGEANRLSGNDGEDALRGGGGDDKLLGGGGNDALFGGGGDDVVIAGAGNDTVFASPGIDSLNGGAGTDLLDLSAHFSNAAVVDLSEGRVILPGGNMATLVSMEQVLGTVADDTIAGSSRRDLLSGNDGADRLVGGDGKDTLIGGDGNDTLFGSAKGDSLSGGAGNDKIGGGKASDTLDGGSGNDFLTGGAQADHLYGGSGNDKLYGGSGNDELDGGAGADVLNGGSGSDSLKGGDDHDTIHGGNGDDSLAGGAMTDTFTFAGNFGHDTIADFSANNHEKIDLSGVSGITGFHNLITHHLDPGPVADSVVIDDGAGDSIVLLGFTTDDFGAGQPVSGADFIFS